MSSPRFGWLSYSALILDKFAAPYISLQLLFIDMEHSIKRSLNYLPKRSEDVRPQIWRASVTELVNFRKCCQIS